MSYFTPHELLLDCCRLWGTLYLSNEPYVPTADAPVTATKGVLSPPQYVEITVNLSRNFISQQRLSLLQRGAPSSLSAVLIQSALSYIRVNMFLPQCWTWLRAGAAAVAQTSGHKIEVINCANSTVCSFSNLYWSSTNWGFNIYKSSLSLRVFSILLTFSIFCSLL